MKRSATKHKEDPGHELTNEQAAGPKEAAPKKKTVRQGSPIRDEKEGKRDADDSQPLAGRAIHNGSAGAFDATEDSHDDDEDGPDNDDFALDRDP